MPVTFHGPYVYYFISYSKQTHQGGAIIIPTLQMQKWRQVELSNCLILHNLVSSLSIHKQKKKYEIRNKLPRYFQEFYEEI